MSRSLWKTPAVSPTYVRYAFLRRNEKAQHVELHFFQRHFYYLLLDANKFARYNIYARSSVILKHFYGVTVRVYRGSRWRTFFVSWWHVGHKFGEFSKTRQRAVFRAKTLNKKKKSSKSEFLKSLRINRLRTIRSGTIKRHRNFTLLGGSNY